MPKASQLRRAPLPRDLWEFLDSNVPTLIIRLLHGYIEELEEQNKSLLQANTAFQIRVNDLARRLDEVEDELTRLKGKRVTSRPTNSLEGSKLRTPRKPKPRYRRDLFWGP